MSNKTKYDKLQKRVNVLEQDVKKTKEKISKICKRNIIDDLSRETFPGSGRYLYTYEDIGDRNDISPATVGRIAEKHGLSRRNKKVV